MVEEKEQPLTWAGLGLWLLWVLGLLMWKYLL